MSGRVTRRTFLATAASAGAVLLSEPARAAAGGEPQAAGIDQRLQPVGSQIVGALQPFPLKQVRLGAGPFRDAAEANRKYLHFLPADRLLHTFRVNAGLSSSAEPVGGWEKPDCELRGHFAGGHFLSACALGYSSFGDDDLRAKGDRMVADLAKCQRALGNGYLSAFPEELFDRLRAGRKVWAPFYTLHKIMAGHLDMYLHCGNEQALKTAEDMAAWVGVYTKGMSEAQLARMLQVEFGGMGEVLCNLSAVTKKEEYLDQARRFDHKAFLDPLAAHRDELQGLHVNTQIPKVIAAARRWELTGDDRYRSIAEYFWRQVTGDRCYCTGGTSNGEIWATPPGVLSTELGEGSAECCCSYNMLKLTRHLFTWTADPRLADFYERTLFNHRLGTQHPGDAALMYYYPLAAGYWKFYGSALNSFWCCTGTGVEEFAKLADSIYVHDDVGVYVNLFIASDVQWPEKGVRIRQETAFPDEQGTSIVVQVDKPVELTLRVRVPWWATSGGTLKLNGTLLGVFGGPSSYLTLTRTWKTGDRVELALPMNLSVHPMPDDPRVQAIMYGPLVLAGRLGAEGLTKAMMYGEYRCYLEGLPAPAPDIVADDIAQASWVEPVGGQPLTFQTVGQSRKVTLIPLNRLFDERYVVYWKVKGKTR